MLKFITLRMVWMLPFLVAISFISFVLIQLPPGDYVTTYIATLAASNEIVDQNTAADLRSRFGLDQPMIVQYWKWISNIVLHGDFGLSFEWQQPVKELIWERMALTLLLIGPLLAQADTALKLPPLEFRERVLANGLTVLSHEDHGSPTVAVQVWYRVGGKDDPPGRSGFAHLFEHMMFKSTRNMPNETFDRLTEDVGGFNNASTYDDFTNYYEVVPAHHLERLIWVESQRLGSLVVDEATFKSERDVVKEELRQRILGVGARVLHQPVGTGQQRIGAPEPLAGTGDDRATALQVGGRCHFGFPHGKKVGTRRMYSA